MRLRAAKLPIMPPVTGCRILTKRPRPKVRSLKTTRLSDRSTYCPPSVLPHEYFTLDSVVAEQRCIRRPRRRQLNLISLWALRGHPSHGIEWGVPSPLAGGAQVKSHSTRSIRPVLGSPIPTFLLSATSAPRLFIFPRMMLFLTAWDIQRLSDVPPVGPQSEGDETGGAGHTDRSRRSPFQILMWLCGTFQLRVGCFKMTEPTQ